MAGLREITESSAFESLLNETGSPLLVVHFSAPWAPQCQQMNDVLTELGKDPQFVHVRFVQLEAESFPEISEKYEITAVPTFIFIKNKKQLDRLDGANVAELTKKVKVLASVVSAPEPPPPVKEDINSRLKKLISSASVMLFMKGTAGEPRCGFSKQIIQILNEKNAEYSTFNILEDEEVRQGLKTYSSWPTYPQLYVNGELIGGLDIIQELAESGELDAQLPKQDSLNDRLKGLISKAPIMVFIKGSPSEPRCGFSKQLIQVLADTGEKYDSFDILSDEEVRQGLKTYSNWPTYPQVYVNGELIGGLDIIKELKESGELESMLKEGQ